MTWPDGIAAATGILTALLILIHQHRSTTQPHHTRRTENDHAQDQAAQAPHRPEEPQDRA